MDLDKITYENPSWVLISYHIISIISLIINSFGIYLIIYKSSKIGNYKYYLLAFVIFSIFVDISFTLGCQFVLTLPVWILITTDGYFWRLFGITSFQSTTILAIFVLFQINIIFYQFVEKHQTIMDLASHTKFILKPAYKLAVKSLGLIFGASVMLIIFSSEIPRQKSLELIQQKYPNLYLRFEKTETFSFLEDNQTMIGSLFYLAFAAALGVLLVSAISYHMLSTFWRVIGTLSDSYKQSHQNAIFSLFAQASTCCIMAIPVFGFLTEAFAFFGSQNQTVLFFHQLLFSCHSSINCIVMIMTVKEYRQFVKSLQTRPLHLFFTRTSPVH